MKNFFLLSIIFLVVGCVNVSYHDENKAAQEANKVVKMLYVDKNFPGVYDRIDPKFQKSATIDDMEKVVSFMEQHHGKLKELKLYAYGPAPQNAINIFYIGENEKSLSYHKIVLLGDGIRGYKVIAFLMKPVPYPENSMMGKFQNNVIIK